MVLRRLFSRLQTTLSSLSLDLKSQVVQTTSLSQYTAKSQGHHCLVMVESQVNHCIIANR